MSARLSGKLAILSAAPFDLMVAIARTAGKLGRTISISQRTLHPVVGKADRETANTAFIPQCGVAPGFMPRLH
ncbi:MAG: hypothetical protein EOR04_18360 [Mesorhizobium sp.]|uniref:hypothetical protein n=1 Tax=Mesorhizobium sp. TaxID=1871066 RepID=UPI000FE4B5B8|nr:hypothetical protein [Mesorhizobium sp.]RWP40582.1 MAG: hypothetical protein EOR04_18360 [Mesorhizobium sp.]